MNIGRAIGRVAGLLAWIILGLTAAGLAWGSGYTTFIVCGTILAAISFWSLTDKDGAR